MRTPVMIAACLCAALLACAASADLIWLDGTRTTENAPPGKLLSDNQNYWGESVLTGVVHHFESVPASGSETGRSQDARDRWAAKQAKKKATEKSLRGESAKGPLVLVMDFKRDCTFSEVDISSRLTKLGIKVECGSWGAGWRTVYDGAQESSPDKPISIYRVKLPEKPKGDRLRISLSAEGAVSMEDAWAWGDAEVTDQDPEAIRPVQPALPAGPYRSCSIPGIERTAIREGDFTKWLKRLGDAAKLPAVWSKVNTWDSISSAPIMPAAEAIDQKASIIMARNETECAAFALTNLSPVKDLVTDVSLGRFTQVGGDGKPAPSISAKLSVMGAVPSAVYGVCLSPLLEQGNMLGQSLMKRYMTNSEMIQDFPHLNMPPTTSAIVWLSVTTDGTPPGTYEATLDCASGSRVPVQVEVLDVTLPRPFAFAESYSRTTEMSPFQYADRNEREAGYKHLLGITVWNNWPEQGSAAEIARKLGTVQYNVYAFPRENRRPKVPFSDSTRQKLMDYVGSLAKEANDLGLSYDQWFVEFYDEPSTADMPILAEYARLVKEVDPNIRIYCNPTTDQVGEWYEKYVDVSFPCGNGGISANKPFSSKRWVNGFYKIQANSSKNESRVQLDRYRGLAWEAMSRGWNGWGFFAYYRPTGNPWYDFDSAKVVGADPDYAIVYPGPHGPVPTRASESLREGWEDYCLISLLRQQGKNDVADAICKSFVPTDGDRRAQAKPLEELRLRALLAAAGRSAPAP